MSEPALVMLDEPMAGVNPALTQSLLEHILDLKDEGMTVLFVEHDMHMVRHIADWVVVMAEGRVVAEGDPVAVMKDPAVIDAYLGAHQDLDLGVVTGRYTGRRSRPDDGCLGLRASRRRGHRGRGHRRSGWRLEVSTASAAPDTTTKLVVEVDNLVAGYLPGVNILNGCSLQARQGELIGIIGPNGAGKSTLLKAIFGQVKVRSGVISLEGEQITGLQANKLVSRGVGFVPQNNNVFPSLTIEENLQMGLYQRPGQYEERLEFVMSIFAELGKRLKQRAGSLSGGERQMVAMSRALMMDPTVLLLDEPSAGLSPVRQDEAFIRVSEINKAGVTTIMVEQNARRCLQICDRGYVLDQGKDAYTGTGRELLNDPKVTELYLGTLGQ